MNNEEKVTSVVEQKLEEQAHGVSHGCSLSSVITTHPALAFGAAPPLRPQTVPSVEECLHGVCLIRYPHRGRGRWSGRDSFLTFNMEVSCVVLIDGANQDFLLLLIILSMCSYYKSLGFARCVCNPVATVNTIM